MIKPLLNSQRNGNIDSVGYARQMSQNRAAGVNILNATQTSNRQSVNAGKERLFGLGNEVVDSQKENQMRSGKRVLVTGGPMSEASNFLSGGYGIDRVGLLENVKPYSK